jgi:hypothetical protein
MKWEFVYEWSNYRLACSLMNSRKGAIPDVLDPFEIEDGLFALELVDFQVVAGGGVTEEVKAEVENTIKRLGLSDRVCCDARAEYAQDYWEGHISLDYLCRHAPFVAKELRRNDRLNPGDE